MYFGDQRGFVFCTGRRRSQPLKNKDLFFLPHLDSSWERMENDLTSKELLAVRKKGQTHTERESNMHHLRDTISHHVLAPISRWGLQWIHTGDPIGIAWLPTEKGDFRHWKRADSRAGKGAQRRHKMVATIWCMYDCLPHTKARKRRLGMIFLL